MAQTDARYLYVFAHGAGAGMQHPFMVRASEALGRHGIATHRYEFPYMKAGKSRPDSPAVAEAAVREAVQEAAKKAPAARLLAGGKSFGGRMTSQAQAREPLPGVRGLVFFGFPLHAPGKPSDERAAHLAQVKVPMLFLQGSRDEFATLDLLQPVVKKLGKLATLELFDDADHSFHVPARSGRKDAEVVRELASVLAAWIATIV